MEEEDYNKNVNLIDKYLTGEISKEDKLLFNTKIKEVEFKQLFDEIQQIKSGIKTLELRRIKSILKEEEQQLQKEAQVISLQKNRSNIINWNFLKIAAILIGVSFGIWWLLSQNNNQQDYFAQHFSPQTNTIVNINKSGENTSPLKEAFILYSNDEHKEFLKAIIPLIEETNNDDFRFYQANALLATNQLDQAIIILSQIVESNKSKFIEDSKWFLALAYLRKGQKEKARPYLEMISDPSIKPNAQIILNTYKD